MSTIYYSEPGRICMAYGCAKVLTGHQKSFCCRACRSSFGPGGPGKSTVTPEFRSSLTGMWADGKTAAAIALWHGITKNSVVGFVNRWGLPARPSPIIRNGVRAPVKPRPPQPQPIALQSFAAAKAPAPQPVPAAPAHKTCQWIFQTKPLLMCDKPSVSGFFWCSEHKSVVYPRRTTPVSFEATA